MPVIVLTADPPGSSQAGLYVERALGVAERRSRLSRVSRVDGRQFSQLTAEQVGAPAALIVLGTRTFDRQGREAVAAYLKNGGRVCSRWGRTSTSRRFADTIGTDPGVERELTPASGAVTLIAVDARHPIFRPFLSPTGALGDVHVEQYRRIEVIRAGRTVLATIFRRGGGAHRADRRHAGGCWCLPLIWTIAGIDFRSTPRSCRLRWKR